MAAVNGGWTRNMRGLASPTVSFDDGRRSNRAIVRLDPGCYLTIRQTATIRPSPGSQSEERVGEEQ
jgi:hypothetical protein